MIPHHHEVHFSHRMGWLRAAVLGANDGIISVASLVIGVAASGATTDTLMITAIAGVVAGAVSMAAGEYVSVQSQADIEAADLMKEAHELAHNPDYELNELTQIYVQRGLTPALALQVAQQLTAHNALHAHARDEIGISDINPAQPVQAALASAASFVLGALCPIMAVWLASDGAVQAAVAVSTCIALLLLGALASYAGGASISRGALRVLFWGIFAMLCTQLIGTWFGTSL